LGVRLHAIIPGSRLVVLPGPKHLTNVEEPDEFDAQVRTFLRAL
jgi:pimeloyl-ACP methyl ester carboxylesterase